MEISALTLKLIIILIPGAITTLVLEKLTVKVSELSPFRFIVFSIVFGTTTYSIIQFVILGFTHINNLIVDYPIKYHWLNVWNNISNEKNIPYTEVLFASLLSIFVGLGISWFNHHKVLNKIAQKFKVSNKYGDENLYMYFLNSNDIGWVYVRSIKYQLTYFGWVQSFSETKDFKEIVLSNVTVYNYPNSKYLYELRNIYLCIDKCDVIIEQANPIN